MFGLTKPQPKAKGAALAQAQNQAPDSIPGMFKPGEFVLPPDTVHAMGGKQALQGVVDATHAPVQTSFGLNAARANAPQAKAAPQLGLKPEVFFANGGAPEDQLAKRAPSPSNTFPGNRLPGSSGFSSAPPSAPTATPKPAPVGMTDTQRTDALAQIPTGGIKAPAPDGSQDAWSNTEAGRNFGNAAAALPGLGGMGRVASTGGAISRSMNAASTASNNAGRAVLGASLLGGTSPAAATSTTSVAPTTPAAGAGRGSINPPLVNPGAPSPAVASTPAAPSNQMVDGVYNHGRGQYSDQAGGMGFPAGFTGKPNAQNDAAAGALSQANSGSFGLQRPAVAAATAAPEVPGLGLYGGRGAEADNQPGWSGSIGQSSGNGNMWSRTPEQQRRDAETQASSIHRQTAANGAAALRSLDGRDLESMRGANALEQENMRQVGGLHRTAMSEAGANQRAALAESGASSRASGQLGLGLRRLSLDQQRASSEDRLREPQIRAAERQGQLQEAYISAKTPEERDVIASQMRAYSGKNDEEWQAVALQGGTDAAGNKTESLLGAVNKRNGEMRKMEASAKMPINENPKALSIKNDASLSLEQKRAALAQLGYS